MVTLCKDAGNDAGNNAGNNAGNDAGNNACSLLSLQLLCSHC